MRVSEQFSRFLGGRYRDDGPWSGEQFRDDFLIPALADAIQNGEQLIIDLDGVAGVPSSFLEEAFGGLLRHTDWAPAQLQRSLKLIANDPDLWPYLKLATTFMEQAAVRRH